MRTRSSWNSSTLLTKGRKTERQEAAELSTPPPPRPDFATTGPTLTFPAILDAGLPPAMVVDEFLLHTMTGTGLMEVLLNTHDVQLDGRTVCTGLRINPTAIAVPAHCGDLTRANVRSYYHPDLQSPPLRHNFYVSVNLSTARDKDLTRIGFLNLSPSDGGFWPYFYGNVDDDLSSTKERYTENKFYLLYAARGTFFLQPVPSLLPESGQLPRPFPFPSAVALRFDGMKQSFVVEGFYLCLHHKERERVEERLVSYHTLLDRFHVEEKKW